MGKWEETSQHLGTIIGQDGNILDSYDRSIAVLNAVLQDIYERLVKEDREGALQAYLTVKGRLASDVEELRRGVDVMRKSQDKLRKISD